MRLKHIVITLLLVAVLIIACASVRSGYANKTKADPGIFKGFPHLLPLGNVSATPSPTAHTWPSPSIYPTPSTFPLLSAR